MDVHFCPGVREEIADGLEQRSGARQFSALFIHIREKS